jgi:hypothetical protein
MFNEELFVPFWLYLTANEPFRLMKAMKYKKTIP